MNTVMFTEDDVRDAFSAQCLIEESKSDSYNCKKEVTPDNLINSYYEKEERPEARARFIRGKAILDRGFRVVRGRYRSTIHATLSEPTLQHVVSPVIQGYSGHIATAEAYRALAIVPVNVVCEEEEHGNG